ncbi:MAG: TonB-dependent receptor, partial [Muribaculaceae bacterium]|nr:TonB-dependent receptor [Muribaculaceae bacterium]
MKRQLALLGALFLTCGSMGTVVNATPAPQVVASSATSIVKGSVVDENGEPIIGASVQEVGTTRGTTTNVKGEFSLKAGVGAKLQISYVGYKTENVKAADGMKVKMVTDNALLDEVVVVGYGQQKKVNLTGAVSNVDLEKTLTARPEQDVTKALQGAIPGLTILTTSGDINEEATMKIRGIGSLNGTGSPLIVVDGVPTENLSMVNGNDIASISVLKDAASSSIYGSRAAFGVILITTKQAKKGDRVSVNYTANFAWDKATYLPDYPDVPTQLEAALRAKARQGSGSVELFGMYFDQLLPYAKKWKEQNSGKIGYGEMRPYVDDNNVGDYRFIGNQPMYYADFDIQDIWYSNAAPSQSHNVTMSGSSGRTRFFTSFGYNAKEDIMKFNPGQRKRYNATVNLQTDITDWLTAGTRINYSRRHFSRADTWNNMYQYIWRWGSFFIPSGTINGEDFRVVAMQKQAARKVTAFDQFKLNAFLKANITKELTVNADFTWQVDDFNSKSTDNSVYGMNWSGTSPQWIVGQSNTDTWRDNSKMETWTANFYVNYAKSINDAHNFNVMAGVNGENMTYDYFYAQRPELYSLDYPELNLTYGDRTKWEINASTNDRASAGYFGRINYDYKGIYLLELNGRYDGSSRFPAGDKWAFFPSGSIGYRFSQEAYWDKLRETVSNGKLRFSYGEIGNENVGSSWPYIATIGTISASYVGWLNGSNTKVNEFDLPEWVSSSLTWERIKTIDIGLDLGLLKDMVTVGFDWYQRTTNDMIAPGKALPPSVGASTPTTNSGSLRTRGWELTINWRKQFSNDLGLYANFSIGDSKSVVTKWDNDQNIGHPLSTAYAYAGQVWGDIWGFETDRYFTEADFTGKNADGSWIYAPGVADQTGIQTQTFVYGPGDIKFKDLDGSGVIDGGKGTVDDHGDLKVIGNCLPRYEYSFHIGGTYKGFDLDLFFQGVGKRDMWTQSSFVFPEMREADLAIYANQTSYNIYEPEKGIVNISESNAFPCLYPGNEYAGNVTGLAGEGGCHNYYPQTKYLVDMSYLRLKNVTLGYTLPVELTKKAFVQKLRFYVSCNNLFLLHKGSGDLPIDP